MSDVLSAEEIARLFAAAKDGNLPDDPHTKRRRTRSIRKIDFSRPMKLSLVEQRRFERAHASFCRDAGEKLSSELRASLELEVINAAQLTWQGALEEVPHPSILGAAACAPGQAVLICVEETLVLRMIERLLGGRFTDTPTPRALTEIDTQLARHLFECLTTALSSVWQELLGLSVKFIDFDLHSTNLEYMPSIQPTLELTVEARDARSSSTIQLLVPHTAIEAGSKRLGNEAQDSGSSDGDRHDADSVRTALSAVQVEARAELGSVDLTIGEVLALATGDVLRLGTAGSAELTVGETPLHYARPGLSGNRRAVKIIESTGLRL